ncbi:hypothetical protein [Brachybacterium sp.]|uniref:hypothetical protein n=1 Tax=Brachybacterium sp. TaxID=1891286 RepID=UPI002ED0749F
MVAREILTPRRRVLAALGAGAMAAGVSACADSAGSDGAVEPAAPVRAADGSSGLVDAPGELADGPGVWAAGSFDGPTEFGITMAGPSHSTDEQFEADLTTQLELGMSWIRIPVVADTVVEEWGFAAGAVVLDRLMLDRIARGAARARERGLKVCMIVADIYDNPAADEDEFLRNMRQYWAGVAEPLVEHVDVWQVFNEPDGAHFRTLDTVPSGQRPEYLRTLARALGAAHQEFERADPEVTITTNLYGYPLNDAMERRWVESLDVLAPHLDVLTVDAYPELSEQEARELPQRIDRLGERYGKEVMLGEIGLQTCSQCWTEAQQAEAYAMYVDLYADSLIPVLFFYQLRDDGTDTGEGTYGILKFDGTPKPALGEISEGLQGF